MQDLTKIYDILIDFIAYLSSENDKVVKDYFINYNKILESTTYVDADEAALQAAIAAIRSKTIFDMLNQLNILLNKYDVSEIDIVKSDKINKDIDDTLKELGSLFKRRKF